MIDFLHLHRFHSQADYLHLLHSHKRAVLPLLHPQVVCNPVTLGHLPLHLLQEPCSLAMVIYCLLPQELGNPAKVGSLLKEPYSPGMGSYCLPLPLLLHRREVPHHLHLHHLEAYRPVQVDYHLLQEPYSFELMTVG